MNSFIALLIIGLIIFIIAVLSNTKEKKLYPRQHQELRPYISKNPLTPTEITFYHRLIEALPEFIVLAQVQLSSFLKVDETQTNYQNHLKWFGPISQQSVDFLICRKDFSIVSAVELDDKSHNGAKAIERDNKKTNNLNAANVPLIRWHAEAMPSTEVIQQAFLKYTSGVTATTSIEPEWLIDDQPSFLKKKQDPIKSILANIVLWLAIAIIIMATINFIKGSIFDITPPHALGTHPTTQQEQMQKSNDRYLSILEMQKREQAAQERARLQAQQTLIAKKNQQKQMQDREAALKEDAWNHYTNYKKSVECTKVDGVVTCGNKVEKNRQQFEYEWEHQRFKFR